jgi:hypothetical protein
MGSARSFEENTSDSDAVVFSLSRGVRPCLSPEVKLCRPCLAGCRVARNAARSSRISRTSGQANGSVPTGAGTGLETGCGIPTSNGRGHVGITGRTGSGSWHSSRSGGRRIASSATASAGSQRILRSRRTVLSVRRRRRCGEGSGSGRLERVRSWPDRPCVTPGLEGAGAIRTALPA